MLFNKKGFFLELEQDSTPPSTPAETVAPVRTEAVEETKTAKTPPAAEAVKPTPAEAPAPQAIDKPKAKGPSLTTAEAIAAELAEAESARPAVTMTTYAPNALQPGNGLRPQRRRQGANLKGFRSMASELFKSSSTGQENSL